MILNWLLICSLCALFIRQSYACTCTSYFNNPYSSMNFCNSCTSDCQLCFLACYTYPPNCNALDPSDCTTCTGCSPGYTLDSSLTCVLSCTMPTNCNTATTNCTCTSCNTGYGLDPSSACALCDSSCNGCSGTNYQACTDCISPNSLNTVSNTCGACSSTCATCATSNYQSCTSCTAGLGLTSTNTCSTCSDPNCYLCYSSYTVCEQCNSPYGLSSGTCISCLSPCLTCSTVSATDCDSCMYNISRIGFDGDTCVACADTRCNMCTLNINACTQCIGVYGVNTNGTCVVCNNSSICKKCPNDYLTCTYCIQGYSVYNGVCLQCTDTAHCLRCPNHTNRCTLCDENTGLTSMNTCTTCAVYNCRTCRNDVSRCTFCVLGTGVNTLTNTSCLACDDSNCYRCGYNYKNCTTCKNVSGSYYPKGVKVMNSTTAYCYDCVDINCLNCNDNYLICTNCLDGYAIRNGSCVACTQTRCTDCTSSLAICTKCRSPYGIDLTINITANPSVCAACDSNCTTCSRTDKDECTSCASTGQYVSNKRCYNCSSHCLYCANGSVCQQCQYLYYIDQNYTCTHCPPYCTYCTLNVTQNWAQCTSCRTYFRLTNQSQFRCDDICGDSYAVLLPCDNQLYIKYDGCTKICEIQDGFQCEVDNNTHVTLCSYNRSVLLQVSDIDKDPYTNSFVLKVKVSPPLDVFKTGTNFNNIFVFNSSIFTTGEISYSSQTEQFSMYCTFTADYIVGPILLTFVPTQQHDQRFYATPSVQFNFTTKLYYQTQFQLTVIKIVKTLSYATVAVGWLGAAMGIGVKRLGGLQAISIIQVTFMGYIWMNSILFRVYEEYKFTKNSFGYNIDLSTLMSGSGSGRRLLTSSYSVQFPSALSQSPPHFSLFNYDTNALYNNFNISMLLQLVPFIVYLITVVIMKVLNNKIKQAKHLESVTLSLNSKQMEDQVKNLEVHYNRTENVKAFVLQCLLYFGILNVPDFINCTTLFFRFSNNVAEITSILVISVTMFLYVMTIIILCCDPDPFSYFRYSFNRSQISMATIYLFIFTLVTTCLLICFVPSNLPYIAPIPFTFLFVFTVIVKPYRQMYENIRACIFQFVLVFVLCLRIFVQNTVFPNKSTATLVYYLIAVILVFLVSLLGVASLIYRAYWLFFIQPYLQKTQKQQIMLQLQTIKMRQKMKCLQNEDNIFRRIITPRMNVLQFNNKLNIECNNTSNNEDSTNGELPKQQMRTPKNGMNFNWQEDQGMGRKMRKNLDKEKLRHVGNYNEGVQLNYSNMYFNQLSNLSVEKPKETIEEYRNYKKREHHYEEQFDNCSPEKAAQLKRLYALKIVVEEKEFLRLKNATQYTDEKTKQEQNKIVEDCLKAYQSIADE